MLISLKSKRISRRALQRSEQHFRSLIENASDMITILDRDGTIRYQSPAVERVLGYTPDQLIETNIFNFAHPDDLERIKYFLEHTRRMTGEDQPVNFRFRRQNGSWCILETIGRDLLDDPVTAGIVINSRDITQRQEVEQALRESEAKFRTLAETAAAGIFIHRAAEFLYVNQAASIITGFDRESLLKMNFWEIAQDDFRLNLQEQGQIYLKKRAGKTRQEFKIVRQDQQIRWVYMSIGVIDFASEPAILGTIFDITERKLAEEALTVAHSQAVEASRLKTQLLANVSHDLRTPLNAILGYTEMLQEGIYDPLTVRQYDATSEIIDSTGQLLNFVNNLLSQAQIEAGKVSINVSSFSPAALLDDVFTVVNGLAQAKGIGLTLEITPDIPLTLMGDPYWLRQILINLIGNAIKFTEQGGVQILIYQSNPTCWAIEVTDTGPGIPAEVQEDLFEAFWQVDGTATREHGGAGLGLSIVKELTTLMNGQVTLKSSVGHGSTFTVILPRQMMTEYAS